MFQLTFTHLVLAIDCAGRWEHTAFLSHSAIQGTESRLLQYSVGIA